MLARGFKSAAGNCQFSGRFSKFEEFEVFIENVII